MSRRALKPFCLPITPAIIEGRLGHARYPGSAIFAANCREISRAFALCRGGAKVQAAVRLFAAVEQQTRILHQLRHSQYKVVSYLVDLAQRSAAWLRAPEDFRPRTTHGRDQIGELVRYLFESYRVPAWLRAALEPQRGRPALAPAFGWYVHVAQGQNLRSAPELPLRLSRRAAHEAQFAPARYPPGQALLYGCLRACAASAAARDALLTATRSHHVVLDDAWLQLFERIARAPEFPVDQVRPLLDYVRAQRAEGACVDLPLAALRRRMERHHAAQREELVRRQALHFGAAFDQRWPSSSSTPSLSGSCEHGDYTMSELRSLRELFEEGQVMQHCVFTYAHAARNGTAAIWSLRLTRAGQEMGRVTVRVTPGDKAVVEARRRCNQGIHGYERELLRHWSASLGWSLAPGV